MSGLTQEVIKKFLRCPNYHFSSLNINSQIKHLLHCCLLFAVVSYFEVVFASSVQSAYDKAAIIDPWKSYGYIMMTCLYLLRCLPLLGLPQMIITFLELVLFNAFPDKQQLKVSPYSVPFICFRIVTRGDFPNVVKTNLEKNLKVCSDVGMENFIMEVVTDKSVNLPEHSRVREVVVPATYATKTGALFKARALQYCLEDDVNILSDSDWIVHLDEENLLTADSVRGIHNFVSDGKHQLGQGTITYGSGKVVNWITTLADSMRVTVDMGYLRCQLNTFLQPLLGWKGSFLAVQVGIERAVSFDHGPDSSVREDTFLAMKADEKGFSSGFIDGEMHEQSPFTMSDIIQQWKRWFQGDRVVHSKKIPFHCKFLLITSWLSSICLPLNTCNILLSKMYPLPPVSELDIASAFICAVGTYMCIFGVLKTFNPARHGIVKFLMCILDPLIISPLLLFAENIALLWSLFGNKYKFSVVEKEVKDS